MEDWSPLWISVQVAFCATVCSVFFGTLLAYGVMKLKRLRPAADVVLTLPLVLPPTVVGFFLLVLLGKKQRGGTVFQQYWTFIYLFHARRCGRSFCRILPSDVPFGQRRDGADGPPASVCGEDPGRRRGKIFLRVILPNCRSGIFAGTILAFARAMGEFGATIMLAGNIPGKTQTMALAVYTAVQSGNREEAFQWAVIIVILSAAAILGVNFFEAGKEYGKGRRVLKLQVELEKKVKTGTIQVKFSLENEVLGILGRSGCGKSVTLKCIAGILQPEKGKIQLDDRVLYDSGEISAGRPESGGSAICFRIMRCFPI